jgi:hypothetical protein
VVTDSRTFSRTKETAKGKERRKSSRSQMAKSPKMSNMS